MASLLPPEGVLLTDPDAVRKAASELLSHYVPSDTGDKNFAEIAKDFGGAGTTCGFLCHWLMFRLGCRDKSLVNRTEHDEGLRYVPGANISKIRNNPYFHVYDPSDIYDTPALGDVVFISNGAPATEHVFIFLEETNAESDEILWTSADAGQTNSSGKQCARVVRRTWKSGQLTGVSSTRKVQGWIPITSIPLTTPFVAAYLP